VFINTLIGVQGMVFWCFLGLCLAGATATTEHRTVLFQSETDRARFAPAQSH
jgi:hypothetical protein